MIAPSGSDPAIVFKDADLAKAAATVVRARFENAGQNCNATKRVYVEREVYDEFVKLVVEKTAALRVGDPMPDQFILYEGGAIDATSLGFMQVDELGNVNSAFAPGRITAPAASP